MGYGEEPYCTGSENKKNRYGIIAQAVRIKNRFGIIARAVRMKKTDLIIKKTG